MSLTMRNALAIILAKDIFHITRACARPMANAIKLYCAAKLISVAIWTLQ